MNLESLVAESRDVRANTDTARVSRAAMTLYCVEPSGPNITAIPAPKAAEGEPKSPAVNLENTIPTAIREMIPRADSMSIEP